MNQKLVEILKSETKSLKEQYINLTVEYAEKEFNRYMEMAKWTYEQWEEKFPLRYMHGNILSKEGMNLKHNIVPKAKRMGKENFIQRAKEEAINHYENSILKLANRIEKKGLNIDNLQVKTSHIGVNIESILTDGEKTVRAFTIIAGGMVQRPHYRYLIK